MTDPQAHESFTDDTLRHYSENTSQPIFARLAAECLRLRGENRLLEVKSRHSLANNLCPDHRDKQKGQPCLACEIERLKRMIEEET